MVGVLVLAGAAVTAVAYRHLNANLRAAPLFAGTRGDAGVETPDAFGNSPINILVIGSDGRGNPADCAIGGDCTSGGANADVEMVVHVSADRTNATVMSVPRDTVTLLPACRDPKSGASMAEHAGQINSTLAYGPGCTVAAVHALTGIPIDHFVMADFAGVVSMSDAIGGVQVCVSDNVYDPYSHLKLTAGSHTLQGLAALEFLRSRHAFGDGSDLGRTYAQHAFLASMIRTLSAAGVLGNPARVVRLAEAATRALTVDDALRSIARLVTLATDVDDVPSSRITFLTMPSSPDPQNPARVVPAASAKALFRAVAQDRPVTPPRPAPSTPGHRPGRPPSSSPSPSAAGATAPDGAHARTADDARTCAPVSRQRTVVLRGVPMSPVTAYARSGDVPVSAP